MYSAAVRVRNCRVRLSRRIPVGQPEKMNRTGIFGATALGTGLIVGLLALAGAPTWALIAAAFGFPFLIWDYLGA